MKGLKKQRRIQIIIAAVVAMAAAFAAFYIALPNAFQYFYSPSDLAEAQPAENETIRIGGLVEEGSLVIGQGEEISFSITDGGATVSVKYIGIRPDLFEEGQGTVATGRMIEGVFHASEILAKHDETYMPKEVVDALKEQGVYQEPES